MDWARIAGKFQAGRYVANHAYMTVLMNHEIAAGLGVVRAHGQNGAFVSQWTIHLNTLQVKWGEDLIQDVYTWDAALNQHVFTPAVQFEPLLLGRPPFIHGVLQPEHRERV